MALLSIRGIGGRRQSAPTLPRIGMEKQPVRDDDRHPTPESRRLTCPSGEILRGGCPRRTSRSWRRPTESKQSAKHDDYGPVESWHERLGAARSGSQAYPLDDPWVVARKVGAPAMSVTTTLRPSFWRAFAFSKPSATASQTVAETSTGRPGLS